MASKPLDAIKGIVGGVRKFLPFSPAKEGPLKDIHRIRLVETIADGIKEAPLLSKVSGIMGKARAGEAVCIPALVDLGGHGLGARRVRVCALKKSAGDMEKTLKWMCRNDNKKQRRASQGARRFSEYVALVTSLPDDVSPEDVLAAYRYRWQVELYFGNY